MKVDDYGTLPAREQSHSFAKFLREPLVHFLLLGAALFGLFSFIGKVTTVSAPQITVSPEKIEELIKGFQFDNKRPPTAQEVDRIINDYVREEVLVREALERGLPQEIPSVRTALRQKMEFQNDSAQEAVPTDQQLQAYLDSHPQSFRKPDGTTPPLAEIRDSVASSWAAAMQRDLRDQAYQKLLAKYRVVIQRPPASAPAAQSAEAK